MAPVSDEAKSVEKPKRARRPAKPKKAAAEAVVETTVVEAAAETPVEPPVAGETAAAVVAEEPAKARPSRRKPAAIDAPVVPVVSSTVADEPEAKAEEKPKRAGWWQRKGFF